MTRITNYFWGYVQGVAGCPRKGCPLLPSKAIQPVNTRRNTMCRGRGGRDRNALEGREYDRIVIFHFGALPAQYFSRSQRERRGPRAAAFHPRSHRISGWGVRWDSQARGGASQRRRWGRNGLLPNSMGRELCGCGGARPSAGSEPYAVPADHSMPGADCWTVGLGQAAAPRQERTERRWAHGHPRARVGRWGG